MTNEAEVRNLMAEFESKVLAHPILKDVRAALLERIHAPTGQPISAVVGPTGVGKSTLSKNMEKEVLLENEEQMQADPGFIPIVCVEVAAPEFSRFSWGDFHVRTLKRFNELLIERKGTDLFEPGQRRIRTGQSSADLRRAVENCLRYRKTRTLIIDEAQHLTRVPHARRLKDQMETIKSIASLSDVQIIMIGTYELLDLLSLNGQLARRTGIIHFPRYRYDVADEFKAFRNVLGMFETLASVGGPSMPAARDSPADNVPSLPPHVFPSVSPRPTWVVLKMR